MTEGYLRPGEAPCLVDRHAAHVDSSGPPRDNPPVPPDAFFRARRQRRPRRVGWPKSWRFGLAAIAAAVATSAPSQAAPTVVPTLLERRPHDASAFTQGLVLDGPTLFESTGLYGSSSLRRVDPVSGAVLFSRALPDDEFAEGLAQVGERLIQLTWMNGLAHVYDAATFEPEAELTYTGEGWGLCFDGQQLVMSDGSERLFFRNAQTFALERTISVQDEGEPVRALNELECLDGTILANVWLEDLIVHIDARSGDVLTRVDASNLRAAEAGRDAEALNGIAFDPANGTYLLTGKYWTSLFVVELDLAPRAQPSSSGTCTVTPSRTSPGSAAGVLAALFAFAARRERRRLTASRDAL